MMTMGIIVKYRRKDRSREYIDMVRESVIKEHKMFISPH